MRIFDVVFSAFLIVILSPVILITTLLIRAILGKPILFKQERPGLHGKPFIFYKFRTMRNDYDKQGNLLSDEERVTRFGNVLRKFSLDELPQLWNVLKGDIAFVGPRPLLMEYLPLYTAEQARRHDVKPGITGWAQINGRNNVSWEEKFKLDVWYVDHKSVALDFKILAKTLIVVLAGKNTTQAGYATAPKFTGKPDRELDHHSR